MNSLLHPLPGARVTQRFGEHPDAYAPYGLAGHEGLDYSAAEGTPVRAAHAGTVQQGNDPTGYGLYIAVQGQGVRTMYAHLSAQTATGNVAAGDVIGLTGNTGNTTGPHLHFGVRPMPVDWANGYKGYVDPEPWLMEVEGEATMGGRVLTFHIESAAELGTEPTMTLRNSNLRWLKAINPHTWATPAKEMFPRQKVIARLHGGGDNWDAQEHIWMRQGAKGARLYLAHFGNAIEKSMREGVAMIEGPNEPHPNDTDNPWNAFVEFQWALAESYAEMGMPYAALVLGNGWLPRIEDIVRFKGVLEYTAAHGGGLALHEYGAPSWLSGDGFWTMRVRKTLDALYAAGVKRNSIPVFITECGITWAALGDADTGFRSHTGYIYPSEYGLPQGVMTEQRYLLQAQGYEEKLMAEAPEVQMAAMFGLLPFTRWKTFAITTEMARWVVNRPGYEATEPEPQPEPEPPAAGPTDAAIRAAAWQAVGVAYNPDAAFPVYARAHGLGAPLGGEVDLGNTRLQPYMGGVVCAVIGDWGNVREVAW